MMRSYEGVCRRMFDINCIAVEFFGIGGTLCISRTEEPERVAKICIGRSSIVLVCVAKDTNINCVTSNVSASWL